MANPVHNPPDCGGLSPQSALWAKSKDVVQYSLRTEGLTEPDVEAHSLAITEAMQKAGVLVGYGSVWDASADEYSPCFADWRKLANFAAWYSKQDAQIRADAISKLSQGFAISFSSWQSPWVATDKHFVPGGVFETRMPSRKTQNGARLYYGVIIGTALTGLALSIYNTFFRKHPSLPHG